MITNCDNGRVYIGSSTSVQDRLATHKTLLRKGKGHHNKHLQSAFSKYGEDSFTFQVIEFCTSALLESREHYWIQAYNANFDGYNKGVDVKCPARGRKQSEEEIENRLAKIRKFRKLVDVNGSLFETNDVPFFAKTHNLRYASLAAVMAGIRYSYNGWRLATKATIGVPHIDIRIGKPKRGRKIPQLNNK